MYFTSFANYNNYSTVKISGNYEKPTKSVWKEGRSGINIYHDQLRILTIMSKYPLSLNARVRTKNITHQFAHNENEQNSISCILSSLRIRAKPDKCRTYPVSDNMASYVFARTFLNF